VGWLLCVRGGPRRCVRLISRNGYAFTALFGPISDALRDFPQSIVLDGEVIVINNDGRPDFQESPGYGRGNGKLPGHLSHKTARSVRR
jgi:hypothetical protein